MPNPVRISYWVVVGAFVVVAWLHLTSAMLAVFFCYFVITKLHFGGTRWIAVGLFAIVLSALAYGLIHFTSQAIIALPKIVQTAVPPFIFHYKYFTTFSICMLLDPLTNKKLS